MKLLDDEVDKKGVVWIAGYAARSKLQVSLLNQVVDLAYQLQPMSTSCSVHNLLRYPVSASASVDLHTNHKSG